MLKAAQFMNDDAAVAAQHNMRLIAYEGRQHLVGVGDWENNSTLTDLFTTTHPRMKDLYLKYLDMWRAARGNEFVAFCSC